MKPIKIWAALAALITLPKKVHKMGALGVSGLSETKRPNPKPRQRHAVKNHKRKHHRQKGRK